MQITKFYLLKHPPNLRASRPCIVNLVPHTVCGICILLVNVCYVCENHKKRKAAFNIDQLRSECLANPRLLSRLRWWYRKYRRLWTKSATLRPIATGLTHGREHSVQSALWAKNSISPIACTLSVLPGYQSPQSIWV